MCQVFVVVFYDEKRVTQTYTHRDAHTYTLPLSFVAGLLCLLSEEKKCSLSTEVSERGGVVFPRVPMNYLLHHRVFARNVITYEHEHTLFKGKDRHTHTSPLIYP